MTREEIITLLEDAIDRLSDLQAFSTPGSWHWEEPVKPGNFPVEDQSLISSTGEKVLFAWTYDGFGGIEATDADRELVVTLHRTIDAQLSILRCALDASNVERNWETLVYTINALELAESILGR